MAASWKIQSERDPPGSSRAKTPQEVAEQRRHRKWQGKGFKDAHSDLAPPFTDSEAWAISFLNATFLLKIGWNNYLSRVICIKYCDVSSSVPGSHGSG